MGAYQRVIDVSTFLGSPEEGVKTATPVATKADEEERVVCWCLWGKPKVLKRLFVKIVLIGIFGIVAYNLIAYFALDHESFWFWYYIAFGYVVLFVWLMAIVIFFSRWCAKKAKKTGDPIPTAMVIPENLIPTALPVSPA
jgi:hypothetical protein